MVAFIAGPLGGIFAETVDRLRQQTCNGGLARSAWTREKIGMTYAVSLDRVNERLDDVILSDDCVPLFGAVFSVQSLGHVFRFQVSD